MRLVLNDKNKIIYVMQSLGPRAFVNLLGSMIFSYNHYYILGKNLLIPQVCPPTVNLKKTVSLITGEDIAYIRKNLDSYEADDRREILSRLFFYEKGFLNCYVMRDGDDIAYMQWLILPDENHLINRYFSDLYYSLTSNQVMLENSFTFPRYRGRGYFLSGTMQLMESAKNSGYRSAICYIRKDRIVPLNEFIQMGFKIIKMVREYKLLGKAWRTI